MGLVPFIKKHLKTARYQGDSGPSSTGRFPQKIEAGVSKRAPGDAGRSNLPAPPVDGGLRGHDTNYPRKKAETPPPATR